MVTITIVDLNNCEDQHYKVEDYGITTEPDRLWMRFENSTIYVMLDKVYSYTVEVTAK